MAFSEAVGQPLTRWQAEPFLSPKRMRVIVAPRQSGKSRALAVFGLWCAFRRSEVQVLVISSGEDASRRVLREIRNFANASPLLRRSVTDEFAGLLTLSNGSQIRSVPASERQVRGWRVDHLLVDEAALVSDDLLLGAALPTTAARPESDTVLASSAAVASGVFFDSAKRGEAGSEHMATFRWALSDCDWISLSQVELYRESMSEARFNAEMHGVFASGADALFTRAALTRITADCALGTLPALTGPARLLGGCDWGATTDRSALCAWARVPVENEAPVFSVVLAHRWAAGYPLNDVISEIVACPAHWAALTSERNGLGEPCTQDLTRRIRERPSEEGGGRLQRRAILVEDRPWTANWNAPTPRKPPSVWDAEKRPWRTSVNAVFTNPANKSAAYSALRLGVDRQQFVIPSGATDLLRELLMLRVDLSPSGERIEAGSGHDDLADALVLAMAPHQRNGRWTTLLERFADPRRPQPTTPQLDLHTVTTPGGRAVPRGLVYQSVSGSQVTNDTTDRLPVGAERRGGWLIQR